MSAHMPLYQLILISRRLMYRISRQPLALPVYELCETFSLYDPLQAQLLGQHIQSDILHPQLRLTHRQQQELPVAAFQTDFKISVHTRMVLRKDVYDPVGTYTVGQKAVIAVPDLRIYRLDISELIYPEVVKGHVHVGAARNPADPLYLAAQEHGYPEYACSGIHIVSSVSFLYEYGYLFSRHTAHLSPSPASFNML